MLLPVFMSVLTLFHSCNALHTTPHLSRLYGKTPPPFKDPLRHFLVYEVSPETFMPQLKKLSLFCALEVASTDGNQSTGHTDATYFSPSPSPDSPGSPLTAETMSSYLFFKPDLLWLLPWNDC